MGFQGMQLPKKRRLAHRCQVVPSDFVALGFKICFVLEMLGGVEEASKGWRPFN